mmetsp:Transcript_5706/g.11376  ORF Transcript_5706/g.11376 Transcript_5706/m.11376 type:complete len:248 (-) Transcript_5706:65-808(-)
MNPDAAIEHELALEGCSVTFRRLSYITNETFHESKRALRLHSSLGITSDEQVRIWCLVFTRSGQIRVVLTPESKSLEAKLEEQEVLGWSLASRTVWARVRRHRCLHSSILGLKDREQHLRWSQQAFSQCNPLLDNRFSAVRSSEVHIERNFPSLSEEALRFQEYLRGDNDTQVIQTSLETDELPHEERHIDASDRTMSTSGKMVTTPSTPVESNTHNVGQRSSAQQSSKRKKEPSPGPLTRYFSRKT